MLSFFEENAGERFNIEVSREGRPVLLFNGATVAFHGPTGYVGVHAGAIAWMPLSVECMEILERTETAITVSYAAPGKAAYHLLFSI